ncbi:DNA polymerase III subunit beta [Clostridium grantii]|uniref:Beta sliding clamp n=1 Tax=Clostridium grantii DSM 8605 TaxID=1121316 RepID=A0A1M5XH58_9CLOT|nr:DNA polymerase III subunit beta [Clostridium grantii]SHH99151.1 DNA polymerase III, beta subunit [Clostridium grantii DSM 8605]
MKFRCEKNKLAEAISVVQKAVSTKSPMEILHSILITAKENQLTLVGTDIDLSIETKIDAIVEEDGIIAVDSKFFGEIVRKLPNSSIKIEKKDKNINIKCEKTEFTLLANLNVDEFPTLPDINENLVFTVNQKLLKNMIKGSIFAIAQDETRPILTGILFEIEGNTLNLVALDGYRLAFRSEFIENENSLTAVIPGKTLSEMSKILSDEEDNVNITFTQNHILFNLGDTKIISRLLEGEFIKYNSIIPKEYNSKITVKRTELLECIERASLMAKDGNTNLIKFDINDENIVITSNSQLGMVREELNIILQGEGLQIAFNSKYLIDVLKIIDENEISLEFSSSVSPCLIKNNENTKFTYLVLPVRLLNSN